MTQRNIVGFFGLWANLRQSGALLCNLDDVENLLVNSSGKHWIITTVVTSRSSVGSGYSANWLVGHCLWYWFSHSGPCYHNLQFFRVSRLVLIIWDLLDCLWIERASTHIPLSILVFGRLCWQQTFSTYQLMMLTMKAWLWNLQIQCRYSFLF